MKENISLKSALRENLKRRKKAINNRDREEIEQDFKQNDNTLKNCVNEK
ncbi:MAG: hypothetical protein AAF621_05165 [Pseudomonadota bacterium]